MLWLALEETEGWGGRRFEEEVEGAGLGHAERIQVCYSQVSIGLSSPLRLDLLPGRQTENGWAQRQSGAYLFTKE